MKTQEKRLLFIIRSLVVFFMVALVVSGVTAFPLETELELLTGIFDKFPANTSAAFIALNAWITEVYSGVRIINQSAPFAAYGTDWLAFAHIVIAIAFIGVYMKPVRNIWIVHFGMIACVLIVPLALICGHIRQIPFFWQMIDCSFGVFGIIPLYFLNKYIQKLGKIIGHQPEKY